MTLNAKFHSLVRAFSILMFFITFAVNFLVYDSPLLSAIIRGMMSLAISYLIINILLLIWRYTFSPTEWDLMIRPHSHQLEELTKDQTISK